MSALQPGQCQNLPPDWETAQRLAPHVLYARIATGEPRPLVVHAIRVDTSAEGIAFHVSPRRPDWREGELETDRQTTRDFMRTARATGIPMVVAINGDAFAPWPAPFNQSTPTDLRGLAIADGVLVSRASNSPSLLVSRWPDEAARSRGQHGDATGRFSLQIATTSQDTDVSTCVAAVSGFALCLEDGQPLPGKPDLHPRTGLGLSHDRRWLYWVVIDGRQPASRGATTE